MTIRQALLWIFSICLMVGCATPQRKLSREEWLQIRNHKYENISPERVLNAVEQLFKLADEKDVRFSHNDNSLKVVRWAAPFPVHIWYHWDIKAIPSETKTNVNVTISTTAHGFGVPGGVTPHDSPDVIGLFYARLDYLLGKSKAWITCDDAKTKNPQGSSLEALCLLAEDLPPVDSNK